MKRLTVCLISCAALAVSLWLAHVVWGQATETKERTRTMTESEWKDILNREVAKALAADRATYGRAGGPVADAEVLNSENWHRARFDNAEWVVYTGPGQAMFHHWLQPATPPAKSSAAAPSTPAGKTN